MIMAYDMDVVTVTDKVPARTTMTAAYYRNFLGDTLHP